MGRADIHREWWEGLISTRVVVGGDSSGWHKEQWREELIVAVGVDGVVVGGADSCRGGRGLVPVVSGADTPQAVMVGGADTPK